MTVTVAGVDGCPAGWVVVTRTLADPATATAIRVSSFAELLAIEPRPVIVAIDVPIGLPDRGIKGGRHCDVAVRALLGARQSSVFGVPPRAAIMCEDYRAACAAALANTDPPRQVSKQCFHLFPKIREVDALMTPALQATVRECHPEAAFYALNGQRPLTEPKKIKSRLHPEGLTLRRKLLSEAGYLPALLTSQPPPGANADDLLDATACSWTAARIAAGTALCLPAEPPRDGRGLRMEIWS